MTDDAVRRWREYVEALPQGTPTWEMSHEATRLASVAIAALQAENAKLKDGIYETAWAGTGCKHSGALYGYCLACKLEEAQAELSRREVCGSCRHCEPYVSPYDDVVHRCGGYPVEPGVWHALLRSQRCVFEPSRWELAGGESDG